MLGNQKISVIPLGSEVCGHLFCTAPVRRAVFFAGSAIAALTVIPRDCKAIRRQHRRNKPFGVRCKPDGERCLHGFLHRVQPISQAHIRFAAAPAQQGKPQNRNGERRPKKGGAPIGISLHGLVTGFRQFGYARLVDGRDPAVRRHDPLTAMQSADVSPIGKLVAVIQPTVGLAEDVGRIHLCKSSLDRSEHEHEVGNILIGRQPQRSW